MEAPGRHVEIQLANADAEAPDTQVTQPQHPGPVCHHHSVHLVTLPVVDHAGHLTAVVTTEEHSPGPPVHVGEVGAGPAHRGCVDDGGHLAEVVHQQPVEQGLVPVLEGLEHIPLPDVVGVHAALDDLVIRLLGGAGGPALAILPHDVLLLVPDTQTE